MDETRGTSFAGTAHNRDDCRYKFNGLSKCGGFAFEMRGRSSFVRLNLFCARRLCEQRERVRRAGLIEREIFMYMRMCEYVKRMFSTLRVSSKISEIKHTFFSLLPHVHLHILILSTVCIVYAIILLIHPNSTACNIPGASLSRKA